MKILNLYAGIGGNRKLWSNGNKVVAVEINKKIADEYKDNFPNDEIVVTDAHQFLLENYEDYDFIWSSPPCQSHSKMVKATRHKIRKFPDMKLYQEIILLQHFCKCKWVVENVKSYYEPLIKPNAILGRHCFWSNFIISYFDVKRPKNFISKGTTDATIELKKWLGLNYNGNLYYDGNHCPGHILRNCVHPKLGLHVYSCAFKKKQIKLLDY